MVFKNTIDSIIFDLDGTLWDPMDVGKKAWRLAAERTQEIKQKVTEDDFKEIFGRQHRLVAKQLFPYCTEDIQRKVMALCYEEELALIKREGGKLFTDVPSVLATLKSKYPLFIVSNCQKGYVEAFLEYHDMKKYFFDHECSGNTGKNKAFNIRRLVSRNNLRYPVYIGDTQGDAEASRANNIPFIYAKYGFGKVEKYDYSINDITEILKIL